MGEDHTIYLASRCWLSTCYIPGTVLGLMLSELYLGLGCGSVASACLACGRPGFDPEHCEQTPENLKSCAEVTFQPAHLFFRKLP